MKRTTAVVWNLVLLALVGAGLGVSPAGAQEATTDVLPPAIGSISVEALIERTCHPGTQGELRGLGRSVPEEHADSP